MEKISISSGCDFLWLAAREVDSVLVDSSDGVSVAAGRLVAYSLPDYMPLTSRPTRWSTSVRSGEWCSAARGASLVNFKIINSSQIEISAESYSEILHVPSPCPVYTAAPLLKMVAEEKVRWKIKKAIPTSPRHPKSRHDAHHDAHHPLIRINSELMEMRSTKESMLLEVEKSPFSMDIALPPWEFSVLLEYAQAGEFELVMGTVSRPYCFMRKNNGVFFLPFRNI